MTGTIQTHRMNHPARIPQRTIFRNLSFCDRFTLPTDRGDRSVSRSAQSVAGAQRAIGPNITASRVPAARPSPPLRSDCLRQVWRVSRRRETWRCGTKYPSDGQSLCLKHHRHCHKHFELTARQSGAAGTIGLEQIIGKRSLIEQRRKEVRWHDDKPGGNCLDGCDNLITAGRAIEDGARARAKRVNGVLAVRSVEQNHQSYPAVSAAIFGQQLLCSGVRQEDIDAIATDRLREGRRLVENPHDDDRRLVAWHCSRLRRKTGSVEKIATATMKADLLQSPPATTPRIARR